MDEAEGQIIYQYQFDITPLEIKTNSKQKPNNKSILLKLGSQEAKATRLNEPMRLLVDVMYSRTLQRFCPLKGIIKIYDVADDGSEFISCVGGFQTEEMLNEGKNNAVISKEIGICTVKMSISITMIAKRN